MPIVSDSNLIVEVLAYSQRKHQVTDVTGGFRSRKRGDNHMGESRREHEESPD